jgi:hypothetical protein
MPKLSIIGREQSKGLLDKIDPYRKGVKMGKVKMVGRIEGEVKYMRSCKNPDGTRKFTDELIIAFLIGGERARLSNGEDCNELIPEYKAPS